MLFVEKVISKLSNEELGLVVGGGIGDVMKELGKGAAHLFIPADGAPWYGLVAQYLADVALITVPAVLTYFGTRKKGEKE